MYESRDERFRRRRRCGDANYDWIGLSEERHGRPIYANERTVELPLRVERDYHYRGGSLRYNERTPQEWERYDQRRDRGGRYDRGRRGGDFDFGRSRERSQERELRQEPSNERRPRRSRFDSEAPVQHSSGTSTPPAADVLQAAMRIGLVPRVRCVLGC